MLSNMWVPEFELEYGLSPLQGAHGVAEAYCRFCERFGAQKPLPATASTDEILKWRESLSKKPVFFRVFNTEKIKKHLEAKHKEEWDVYKLLPDSEKQSYLLAPDAFIPHGERFQLMIPQGILKVASLADSHTAESGSVQDQQVDVFDAFDPSIDTKFTKFSVDKVGQFHTTLLAVNATETFASVPKMFKIFRYAYHSAIFGLPDDRQVSKTVRKTLPLCLYALRLLLQKAWGFSVLVDESTHKSNSYLSIRVSFALKTELYNFHALVVPLKDNRHTSDNYARIVISMLKNAFGGNILSKLVAITVDGTSTMTGRRGGFALQVKNACPDNLGESVMVMWCGAHKLQCAMGRLLSSLENICDFRASLDAEIAFARKNYANRMCPQYTEVKWGSLPKCVHFLNDHYAELIRLHENTSLLPLRQSSRAWWNCLRAIVTLTNEVDKCFKRLQYKTVTIRAQYEAFADLARALKQTFGAPVANRNSSEPNLFTRSVCNHLRSCCGNEFQGQGSYEKLRQSRGLSDALERFILEIDNMQTEVDMNDSGESLPRPPITPEDVWKGDADTFLLFLERHRVRLTNCFAPATVDIIRQQYSLLRERAQTNPDFQERITVARRLVFTDQWFFVDVYQEFDELSNFMGGLASIAAGTHTVEGDFSNLKRLKNSLRSQLSDAALIGQLHAKQYPELISLANANVEKRASTRGRNTASPEQTISSGSQIDGDSEGPSQVSSLEISVGTSLDDMVRSIAPDFENNGFRVVGTDSDEFLGECMQWLLEQFELPSDMESEEL